MKTEKILEQVNKIISQLNEEQKTAVDKIVSYGKNPLDTLESCIANLKIDLIECIKTESAKNNGNTAKVKAAEKLLKMMTEIRNEYKFYGKLYPAFDVDGEQLIVSPYIVVKLCKPIELRTANEQEQQNEQKSINMFINVIKSTADNNGDSVKCPSVSELTAYIKLWKADHDKKDIPKYDFGEGKPAVNAEYLKSIATLLGEECKLVFSSKSLVTPIYCESENGTGVLMPMKK